ncbi:hypothetical protein LTR12_000860 [Friedmanniomyces endolithicus]|nr:hypothetical protein LTR12_000860 [Friedmanniomyces endolithicus]
METEARTEAYNAMHTITMRHYREDRLDEAFELAGKLLLHAEEAVRILNVDCREGLEDPANFPQKQYDEALRLLKEAKDSKTEDDVAKAAGTYGTPNRGEGGVEGEAKEEAKEEGGGRISAADNQAINQAMALYPDMKMDASSA